MSIIWARTPSLEQLNAATAGTMMRALGIVFTEEGPDFIRAAMPVDERTRQPYGLLHGGVLMTLLDGASGFACTFNDTATARRLSVTTASDTPAKNKNSGAGIEPMNCVHT